jgi:hypothetical protein
MLEVTRKDHSAGINCSMNEKRLGATRMATTITFNLEKKQTPPLDPNESDAETL